MRRTARGGTIALALALAMPPMPAVADIFDQVEQIVSWFDRLNRSWDGVVDRQVRLQLLRSVDRLSRSLYLLEADTRLLRDTIGDATPSPEEADQLVANVAALRTALNEVTGASRALGSDLRLLGGGDADALTTRATASRTLALNTLDRQLADPRRWNAALVRSRLNGGLLALAPAQTALRQFRGRIAR